jgi:hypothetical protein
MDEPTPSYRVEASDADPTSERGREHFASLFEESPDPAAVRTFAKAIAPGTALGTHRHTAGRAATRSGSGPASCTTS